MKILKIHPARNPRPPSDLNWGEIYSTGHPWLLKRPYWSLVLRSFSGLYLQNQNCHGPSQIQLPRTVLCGKLWDRINSKKWWMLLDACSQSLIVQSSAFRVQSLQCTVFIKQVKVQSSSCTVWAGHWFEFATSGFYHRGEQPYHSLLGWGWWWLWWWHRQWWWLWWGQHWQWCCIGFYHSIQSLAVAKPEVTQVKGGVRDISGIRGWGCFKLNQSKTRPSKLFIHQAPRIANSPCFYCCCCVHHKKPGLP